MTLEFTEDISDTENIKEALKLAVIEAVDLGEEDVQLLEINGIFIFQVPNRTHAFIW